MSLAAQRDTNTTYAIHGTDKTGTADPTQIDVFKKNDKNH